MVVRLIVLTVTCEVSTGPAGPMIWSTLAAVKLDVFMFRSKTTWSELFVLLRTRLSAPEPPGTEVLTTCGPGTIRGRVWVLNGGRRSVSGLVPKMVWLRGAGMGAT